MPLKRIFRDFQRTLIWDVFFIRKIEATFVCLALNHFRTLIPFLFITYAG